MAALLRPVRQNLADAARFGAVHAAGVRLLERLQAIGPSAVDDIGGAAASSPRERMRKAREMIGASADLLGPGDAERFAELGVFAAGALMPFGLVSRLWQVTAGLDALQASQVCARLGELALVSVTDIGIGGLTLHDVFRDVLRSELGRNGWRA